MTVARANNWLRLLLLLIDHVGSLVNFPADDSRGLQAHSKLALNRYQAGGLR